MQGSLQYRGPVDVVRQVMKGEGGMLGMYKGLLPTMVREVAGCSAMFAAYEAIKLGVVKQQVPLPHLLLTCVAQFRTKRTVPKSSRHAKQTGGKLARYQHHPSDACRYRTAGVV